MSDRIAIPVGEHVLAFDAADIDYLSNTHGDVAELGPDENGAPRRILAGQARITVVLKPGTHAVWEKP